MRICWADEVREDCPQWQTQDRRTLKGINPLIRDTVRNGNEELDKPETLRYQLFGYQSRRITEEHRPVYRIIDTEVQITVRRYHYGRRGPLPRGQSTQLRSTQPRFGRQTAG